MATAETTTFGEVIGRYRCAAGLTQEELAQRAGVSVRTIGALEGGPLVTPRKDIMSMLADALGPDHDARAHLEAARRTNLSASLSSRYSRTSRRAVSTIAVVAKTRIAGDHHERTTPLCSADTRG